MVCSTGSAKKLPKTSDERAYEFHLEEFKALRAEIHAYQERRYQFNRLTIAGILAALLALMGPYHEQLSRLYGIAWFTPFGLSLGCLLFQKSANDSIRILGRYLTEIEKKYADKDLMGWERTIFALRGFDGKTKNAVPGRVASTSKPETESTAARERVIDKEALAKKFPENAKTYSDFSIRFWKATTFAFGLVGVVALVVSAHVV